MRTSKSKLDAESYGDGCLAGHLRAQEWKNNPRRGDPSVGGTLQYIILDLAQKMREAKESDIKRVRGEIVGFCYALECPESADACIAAARKAKEQAKQQGGHQQ